MVTHDTVTVRLGDGTGEVMKGRSEATYFVSGTYGFEVELCQRLNDIAGTLQKIFPYEWSESKKFVPHIAILVNNLHLLDYCRFSGLAGT